MTSSSVSNNDPLKSVFTYGFNKTIHRTGALEVEVDDQGRVVAVWFRCMMLPFKQHKVDQERAHDMETASAAIEHTIEAVELGNFGP